MVSKILINNVFVILLFSSIVQSSSVGLKQRTERDCNPAELLKTNCEAYPNQKCVLTDNGASCVCKTDYVTDVEKTNDQRLVCKSEKFKKYKKRECDQDELEKTNCDENQKCEGTEFGVFCACKMGYVKDVEKSNQGKLVCKIRACNMKEIVKLNCEANPNQRCVFKETGAICDCKPDYVRDEKNSNEVTLVCKIRDCNTAELDKTNCAANLNQKCVLTKYGALCDCKTDYVTDEEKSDYETLVCRIRDCNRNEIIETNCAANPNQRCVFKETGASCECEYDHVKDEERSTNDTLVCIMRDCNQDELEQTQCEVNQNQRCVSTDYGAFCICKANYVRDEQMSNQDTLVCKIRDCSSQEITNLECSYKSNQECKVIDMNEDITASCVCKPNYVLDEKFSNDNNLVCKIRDCSPQEEKTLECSEKPNQECIVTDVGGYMKASCVCKQNYVKDEKASTGTNLVCKIRDCSSQEKFELKCSVKPNQECTVTDMSGYLKASCACKINYEKDEIISTETNLVCKKIDHCISNSCPKETTTCKSEDSDYYCECLPGFQLNTGNVLKLNKEECTQIDYCHPNSCPERTTTCKSEGTDYYCECLPGFELKDGHDIKSNKDKCTQIDHCLLNSCPEGTTTCKSEETDFYCECLAGFKLKEGHDMKSNKDKCNKDYKIYSSTNFFSLNV